MPTKGRLPEFRRDPRGALVSFIADQPEPPPIRDGELVGTVMGKIDMENRVRRPVAPGLALVGDAALAIDPLWGVGCGFAFQTAEWLADSVDARAAAAPSRSTTAWSATAGATRAGCRGHAQMMLDYASGRRFNPGERMIFSAAARATARSRALTSVRDAADRPGRMLARTSRARSSSTRAARCGTRGPAAPASAEREREAVAA